MPLIIQPSKEAGVGHNRISHEQLKTIVERIEKVNSDIADLRADVRDIYAEAKGNGYDVKTIRKIIARRKLSEDERAEQDALFETYKGVFE